MQPSRVLITGAFLLAGVSNAMAASSVDLSVVGTITPSACTPILSNNGLVDHGKISAQDLPDFGYKVLPKATLQLEVTCSAPTMMAIKITDNRAGTAIPSYSGDEEVSHFGLGLASGGKKIGWYYLLMVNATADGKSAALIESIDKKTWLDASDNTAWQPDWMRTARSSSGTPLALTSLTAEVVVNTTIVSKRALPIAEEIQIDGSSTLTVEYL